MNFGYIKRKKRKEDYVLGGKSGLLHGVLQLGGNWLEWLPAGEKQRKGIDTKGCVSFGICNILEILHKRKFGSEKNFSDRYIAVASGTTRRGNSIRAVIETARKISGMIAEELYPFEGKSWAEYHKELPKRLWDIGRRWLQKFAIGYEWVKPNEKDIIEALEYSPLGVSVYAWAKKGKKYYKAGRDNHFTVLVGYEYGKHWIVFDSYTDKGSFIKKLEWNYFTPETQIIRLSLEPANFLSKFISYLWSLFR